jgi:hypothetical protein
MQARRPRSPRLFFKGIRAHALCDVAESASKFAMAGFREFLLRNNVRAAEALPLVHSTPALHLRDIRQSQRLVAAPCDVFGGERLNYFFVGRPAYKYRADAGETPYWELPCCFIFDFMMMRPFTRVFPFDSGAFHRRLYPTYIESFDMAEFDVANIPDAPERIVGAFFGDARAYFGLRPKTEGEFNQQFSLGAFDYEVKALHRLAFERTATSFDDRRLTIEVQTNSDVDMTINRPLAVIAPSVFYDDQGFADHVTDVWNAQPLSYPIYPLNVSAYYAAIYERVHAFYLQVGLIV